MNFRHPLQAAGQWLRGEFHMNHAPVRGPRRLRGGVQQKRAHRQDSAARDFTQDFRRLRRQRRKQHARILSPPVSQSTVLITGL